MYLIFVFFDDRSFTYIIPETPGEDLIDVSIVLISPAGVISLIIALSNLIFLGLGFLYKAIHSTGILRKKFFFLSLGNHLLLIFGALDVFTSIDIILIFERIGIFPGVNIRQLKAPISIYHQLNPAEYAKSLVHLQLQYPHITTSRAKRCCRA